MNSVISFFVGSVTFVLMMLIKIPVKKVTGALSKRVDEERREIVRKRLNIVLVVIVMLLACLIYVLVLRMLRDNHFKLCYALKAGVIAMALYAVYERFL